MTQYMATDRALGFLLIALAFVAVPLHAEWALCAVAGYALGRVRGALAVVLACIGIEVAGLLLGATTLGSLATGGSAPGLIAFAGPPSGALTFAWLPSAIAAADPGRLLAVVRGADHLPLLVIQPVIWAVAATVSGMGESGRSGWRAVLAGAAAVVTAAVASIGVDIAVGGPVGMTTFGTVGVVSFAVALVAIVFGEWVFPRQARVEQRPSGGAAVGFRSEDADVDDLLRLIASAEDELMARHQTQAVVLITDVKSFAALTERIGSIESAKLVQRHRDTLLPVIERHGGAGKSTGGDGLVAAFTSAHDAVAAAIEMQQTLEQSARSDPGAPELLVRIGIAQGDVVLDRGGRPFLGAALNLAARIMDLADGGRIMVAGAVAEASGLPPSLMHRHGEFTLKNIAEPVPVVEVLWNAGLAPQHVDST
jgi:class 3 adenylate cyclase